MDWWLIVIVVLSSILAAVILLTTATGFTGYFLSLRRGNALGRRINRVYQKGIEKYACDYSWWDNQSADKLVMENDGLKQVAFLLKTETYSKKIAILLHGYFQNHKDMQPYIKMFLDNGINVLAPDARAHGGSEGKTVGMGWLDRTDILKWIEMIIQLYGPDCEIVLHGISMGAATMCITAGDENLPANVKCVISDSAFDSAYTLFSYLLRRFLAIPFLVLPLATKFSKWMGGYDIRRANCLPHVAGTKLPILFIHGEKDRFVPTYMSSNLYHTHQPEGREIYLVAKAKHCMSYAVNPKEYTRFVMKFTRSYLKN